jgi:ribosomal-protein-alanine N-acetyltransferase
VSAVVSSEIPVLRAMRVEDLAQVVEIERAAYEFPWTSGIFRDCLVFGYDSRVLENAFGVLGYGIMSVAAGECHLLNVCIHPAWQGQGLGRRLVEHLLELARRKNSRLALLEVRRSNRIAYQLYHSLGFNELGVRRGYYPAKNGREDALILARDL